MKRKISIRGFLQSSKVCDELKHAGNALEFSDMELKVTEHPDVDIRSLQARPDVLIIELDARDMNSLNEILSVLKDNDGKITTLILLNNSDTDIVRSLMRTHVYDVIPLPCDEKELLTDLKAIIQEKQKHLDSVKSQVITFLNAKGGSGSTTLAVNTAYMLATKFDASVCLVDLDIQFGKVALFLDSIPAENIMSALRQPERIDPIYMKALVTHHPSGLDILAAPGALNDITEITPESVGLLIDAISENYDYVLIDMPHVILPWSIEALRKGDRNFLVVQSCLSIMKDAKLLLDKLDKYGIDKNRFELINNRESKNTGLIRKKQMLELLGKEECFSVRNDYEVAIEAQETGKPIEKVALASGINRDIESIAKALKNGYSSTEKHMGFFTRIFHDRG